MIWYLMIVKYISFPRIFLYAYLPFVYVDTFISHG